MNAFYGKDLAYTHDVGFRFFADQTSPGVLKLLAKHKIKEGLVADLGCGTGIWAENLCKAGYEVEGVDISRGMLSIARKRVPQAKFRCGSYLDVKLPKCDAITSLGECLSYLFDKKVSSTAALPRLFRRVYDALRPGGIFIFDVVKLPRWRKSRSWESHWEGDDWAILLKAHKDPLRRTFVREVTTFRKICKTYRRSEETHQQRMYKASEVAESLRKIGFKTEILSGYGSYQFDDSHVGFLARKPR